MTTKKKRTLLGQKIRRLRQDRALTQQEMAAQLGISASYLNLIEHDERPATVSLLLKLAQAFGIDLNTLSDDSERRLAAALGEVFADAGLADKDIDSDEIARLVTSAPKAARAIADAVRGGGLSTPEGEMLCRVGLANYFAGATLMPYAPFLAAAEAARYDVEPLMHRFGVSVEHAARRLSTLNRPGNAGIPFFFARADIAGNISKRFSAADE